MYDRNIPEKKISWRVERKKSSHLIFCKGNAKYILFKRNDKIPTKFPKILVLLCVKYLIEKKSDFWKSLKKYMNMILLLKLFSTQKKFKNQDWYGLFIKTNSWIDLCPATQINSTANICFPCTNRVFCARLLCYVSAQERSLKMQKYG